MTCSIRSHVGARPVLGLQVLCELGGSLSHAGVEHPSYRRFEVVDVAAACGDHRPDSESGESASGLGGQEIVENRRLLT